MGHVQPVSGLGAGAGTGGTDGFVEVGIGGAVGRWGMVFGFLGADSVIRRLTCRASGLPRENVAGLEVDAEEDEELSGLIGFFGLMTPPPLPVGFAGVAGMYWSPYSFLSSS